MALRHVLLDFGQEHGQVFLRDRHHPALVAVEDRDRAPPVALAGEQPVPQAVADGRPAAAARLEPFHDGLLRLRARHARELRRVDQFLVTRVTDERGAFLDLAVGRHDDRLDRELVPLGEGVVALVVGRDAHDRSGAVLHQHVVRHPDRESVVVDRIRNEVTCEDARLLLLRVRPFDGRPCGGMTRVLEHLLLVGSSLRQPRDERVLRREHEEGGPEERVRPGREDGDVDVELLDPEDDLGALGTADPVALHREDSLRPRLEQVHLLEQPIGVGGDAEEPLLEATGLHLPAAALTVTVDHLLDGHCERCGWEVEARSLEQWFFRITAYADRLLEEMNLLESWPERVLTMQRNWIGRSEGAEVVFRIEELDIDLPVFTTRPDTLFGATFFVVAPEHPLVAQLAQGTPHEQEVLEYARHAAAHTTVERADPDKEKTGVFTGHFVTNPVNDNRLPVWVSDYVLMEYGTGAIMGVPAHDERDFAFAQRFELPIKPVVVPADGEVEEGTAFIGHSGDEKLIDSAQFSGMSSTEAKEAIVEWLESRGSGRPAVSYRLRDWLLSRQRYWGCPIPIVHCDGCGPVPVPEEQLPVLLPEVDDYLPKGKSPLAAAEDWVNTTCPTC